MLCAHLFPCAPYADLFLYIRGGYIHVHAPMCNGKYVHVVNMVPRALDEKVI